MQWQYLDVPMIFRDKWTEINLQNQTLKDDKAYDYIDSLGRKGWDLAAAVPILVNGTTRGQRLWFKRARPTPKTEQAQPSQSSQAPSS